MCNTYIHNIYEYILHTWSSKANCYNSVANTCASKPYMYINNDIYGYNNMLC